MIFDWVMLVVRAICTICVSSLLPAVALAQVPGIGPNGQPLPPRQQKGMIGGAQPMNPGGAENVGGGANAGLQKIATTGTVVKLGPNSLLVKTDQGQELILNLNAVRKHGGLEYTGMEPPVFELRAESGISSLRTGQFVRFTAELGGTRKIKTQQPVNEIEVFTPTKQTVFGTMKSDLGGDVAAEVPPPAFPGKQLPLDGPAARPYQGPGNYLCVGRITSSRGKNQVVAFPGGSIQLELDLEAKVQIVSANHRDAEVGDPVAFTGRSPMPPMVFAEHVIIDRENPEAAKREVLQEVPGGGAGGALAGNPGGGVGDDPLAQPGGGVGGPDVAGGAGGAARPELPRGPHRVDGEFGGGRRDDLGGGVGGDFIPDRVDKPMILKIN